MSPTTIFKGLVLLYELGGELWQERKRRKQAEKWPAVPAAIRACFKCKEVAYIPGQLSCNKCGALL